MQDDLVALFTYDRWANRKVLEACRQSGFKPTVVSESSHWDFIVALVAANIGVAFLPTAICDQLDPDHVCSVPLGEPVIPWEAALVWRRDRHLPPATRAWLALSERRLVDEEPARPAPRKRTRR